MTSQYWLYSYHFHKLKNQTTQINVSLPLHDAVTMSLYADNYYVGHYHQVHKVMMVHHRHNQKVSDSQSHQVKVVHQVMGKEMAFQQVSTPWTQILYNKIYF